jgi:hypothetical protein
MTQLFIAVWQKEAFQPQSGTFAGAISEGFCFTMFFMRA